MKIFLVTNHSFMLYKFRKELIGELLKEHDVTLVMPAKDYTQAFRTMGCNIINIDVDRRSVSVKKDYNLFKKYYKLFKEQKPDMVITYSIKSNIYAGLSASLLGIPYCANIQGLGTAFQSQPLATIVSTLYKISLSRAKTIFFENESNMNEFINRKIISKDKVCLLRGAGVNLDEYSFEEMKPTNETRFVFVGRIMKEKGVDELLEAFNRLKRIYNVRLDIIGPFEDDYETLITDVDKDPRINYLGFLNDVRPHVKKAHALVLPSYHEGMANTILEASAMGRAVITSNIPGCKEGVIDNKSGLLVNVKDANDLYQKMRLFTLLSNEAKIQMGRNARKHVENQFDKKQVVKQTIDAIVR